MPTPSGGKGWVVSTDETVQRRKSCEDVAPVMWILGDRGAPVNPRPCGEMGLFFLLRTEALFL